MAPSVLPTTDSNWNVCSIQQNLTWAQLFKANDVLVNNSLKFTSSDTQICWNF